MIHHSPGNIAAQNLGSILEKKILKDNGKKNLTKSVLAVYKTSTPPVVCVVKIKFPYLL
jgi:hypothetical protein